MQRLVLWVALALFPSLQTAAQESPKDYRQTASAFSRRTVETRELRVSEMQLGRLGLDTNRFTARVRNKSDSAIVLGLSLRAVPGLWIPRNWQHGYRFVVPAHASQRISANYVFARMTPEATLRVMLGPPVGAGSAIAVPQPFYDTTLAVGRGNPAASDPRVAFDTLSTAHFELFAWRGGVAARRLALIAAEREAALQRIAELLGVEFSGRIRLVFYPDSASKTNQTGHRGAGFANGSTIVEILNDSVQLDPYHEVAHIVGYRRGAPPAFVDEGFAVHVSELLGADALRYLGAPGKSVSTTVCGMRASGSLLPLARLFRFTDIGSDSTTPGIAYPEAASVVAFLIQSRGIERFRDLYERLQNTEDRAAQARNEQVLQELYGWNVSGLDSAWRAALPCEPAAPSAFLLTRLGLALTVGYDRGTLGGTATLTLRNSSDHPAATVPLLLNRLMTVASVQTASGNPLPFEQRFALFQDDSSRQVNAITVTPGQPVAPGDSLTFTLQYGGVLVGYTETGSLYIKDRVNRDFTIIREDAYAFPTPGLLSRRANRAAARGDFHFSARVTVPGPLVVAMGGAADSLTRQDSLVTWRYHSVAPVPFLNITIAPYRMLEAPGARIFYFPADSSGSRMVAEGIAGAMQRLARWYGPLGRESQLTVMEIPDGFGSQGNLNAGIMQDARTFRDRSELYQLYHELSHLWNVTDRETPSPRWNEGLASFLEFRIAAELDGWKDWDALLGQRVESLLRRCAGARCDTVPLATYGQAGMTGYSYSVGMLLFYTLYQVLGAEAFDRTYRGFFQRFRDTGATTADLLAAFRAADPRSERILTDWLSTPRWYARLTAGETLPAMIEAYRKP